VPKWCRSLWGESDIDERIPRKKFGWVEPDGRSHGQPTNHHAECYAMSVLERTVVPQAWSLIVDGQMVPSSAPDWFSIATFETLYECFILAGTAPSRTPRLGGVFSYGETLLESALEVHPDEGNAAPRSLRGIRDSHLELGYALADPDVLAMPSSGGALVAIEAKTAGGDQLHADGGQENALTLLESLGAIAEVWWIRDESVPFGLGNKSIRPRPPFASAETRVRVRSGIDWREARSRALAAVRRRSRHV